LKESAQIYLYSVNMIKNGINTNPVEQMEILLDDEAIGIGRKTLCSQ